tara:strand:+ start:402 stop:1175 length:774 start_codon:yes stop_codon:yes gene_type:complete
MSQNIKISKNRILELGKANNKNYNIELCGTAALASVNKDLQAAVNEGFVDLEKSCFKDNYVDEQLFYCIDRISNADSSSVLCEIGIGTVIDKGQTLKRINPMFYVEDEETVPSNNKFREFFSDTPNTHILVTTYTPTHFGQFFVQKNTMFATSTEPYIPLMVSVDDNSLIGRFDDDIQSISFNDLHNDTITHIQKYTKQLILKSSRLDVKKIKTNQLTLDPHKKPDAKRGTLFYNDNVDALQYFDGKVWRTILCQDS